MSNKDLRTYNVISSRLLGGSVQGSTRSTKQTEASYLTGHVQVNTVLDQVTVDSRDRRFHRPVRAQYMQRAGGVTLCSSHSPETLVSLANSGTGPGSYSLS